MVARVELSSNKIDLKLSSPSREGPPRNPPAHLCYVWQTKKAMHSTTCALPLTLDKNMQNLLLNLNQ